MSSAFFRRPGESSSESSSDDDDTEEHHHSQKSSDSLQDPDIELTKTESLPIEAGVKSPGERPTLQPDSNVPNATKHQDLMFASLLEEFCRTRAAELINTGAAGSNYHRLSPEIQPLAQKLYAESSQALASNGFVSPTSTAMNMGNVRKQYLAGLDNLSMRNLSDHDLAPARKIGRLGDTDEIEMALVKTERRRSIELIKAFDEPLGNILMQTARMSISSPQTDMQMSFTRTSHYESSFQQLRLLGRGGFGRVYHAFNIFDKKEYAVKKIPLSPKLSQRYRKGGHQELATVLREVQALAQLEHSNCVRYHACWVEEPKSPDPASPEVSPKKTRPKPQRQITNYAHVSSPPPNNADPPSIYVDFEPSDGIVFGGDDSHPRPAVNEWSAVSYTEDSILPTRASEIFTDGQARSIDHSDTSIDHSVHVLHVQMSMYPLTLTQYLAPTPSNSSSALSSPPRRHCFHLFPSLRILLGILCGLQYIHAKGLIHRDIKPGNIFLSAATTGTGIALSEGFWDVGSCPSCPDAVPYYVNPRIGDFGLVSELAKSAEPGLDDDAGHGLGIKPVGTALYHPPVDETKAHRSRAAIDEKLDVFALGIILVEMLCAFGTSSERTHVLRDMQDGKIPSSLAAEIEAEGVGDKGIGNNVRDCIKGMTLRDAKERWGCQKVKEAIEGILKDCGAGPVTELQGARIQKVRSLTGTEIDGT